MLVRKLSTISTFFPVHHSTFCDYSMFFASLFFAKFDAIFVDFIWFSREAADFTIFRQTFAVFSRNFAEIQWFWQRWSQDCSISSKCENKIAEILLQICLKKKVLLSTFYHALNPSGNSKPDGSARNRSAGQPSAKPSLVGPSAAFVVRIFPICLACVCTGRSALPGSGLAKLVKL